MKLKLAVFTIFIQSVLFAQNPINIQILGACNPFSETYSFVNLLNGKYNYMQNFVVEGNPTTVYVSFDSTKWVLHNGNILDTGFINNNVTDSLSPPSDNWEPTGCQDGTLVINEILKNDTFIKSKISIFPNPSYNSITIKNLNKINETFNYKIIDLSGRIIKTNIAKFNEAINIENLNYGTYLIQLTDLKNNSFSQILIKK